MDVGQRAPKLGFREIELAGFQLAPDLRQGAHHRPEILFRGVEHFVGLLLIVGILGIDAHPRAIQVCFP